MEVQNRVLTVIECLNLLRSNASTQWRKIILLFHAIITVAFLEREESFMLERVFSRTCEIKTDKGARK